MSPHSKSTEMDGDYGARQQAQRYCVNPGLMLTSGIIHHTIRNLDHHKLASLYKCALSRFKTCIQSFLYVPD